MRTMDSQQTEATEASRKFPPTIVYGVMLIWIGAVIGIAFIVDVQTAAYALALSLLVSALARLALPNGAIPRVRSKIHDAGIATIFAVLLLALGRWGNAPPV